MKARPKKTSASPKTRPSRARAAPKAKPSHAKTSKPRAKLPPRFPYVSIEVADAQAEDAGALLFELGAQGIEHRDATTLVRAGSGVTLVGSFATRAAAKQAIDHLPGAWSPAVGEVIGDEWRDAWKKHFEPFHITDRLVIRPPWRAYAAKARERVIVLEPGRAFGTGLHETTSLVARILSERAGAVRGASVLDVGCGSGILGLVALAVGAGRVRAVDNDPEAVAATRENARRNATTRRLSADETPVGRITETFDVVVANIDAATLVALAPAIAARTSGLLVLSGLLAPEVDDSQWDRVRRAFEPMPVLEVVQKGEWIAAVLGA